MRILLVGEYSRLHNSLKEGLVKLGHEVIIISSGDGFKNFPSDILIKKKYTTGLLKKIKIFIYKLFRIDITSLAVKKQIFNTKNILKGFDVVQLINESPFNVSPNIERKLFDFLKMHNKKIFLLSSGTDYISVKYALDRKLKYSILTPFFDKKVSKKDFDPIFKYVTPEFKKLHQHIYSNINGVIASDIDYHLPLKNHPKYVGLIPNPINIHLIQKQKIKLDGKIVIFHGINKTNYFKKGNDYFEKALKIISMKYPDKTQIITVESLPYSEYIKQYNSAHILLDQVYSFDQGYNALEAMAKGKVVFTGVEKIFTNHYQLNKIVAINAVPKVDYIVNQLEDLILNPHKIELISNNARNFIEEHHNYINVAKTFLNTWQLH